MGSRSLSWKSRVAQPGDHARAGFRSLVVPVYRGSTTLFDDAAAVVDTWDQDRAAYTYGQYGTPTSFELAARIAELDGGYRTFITPGGQAALALVYLSLLSAGDHVLLPASIYGPSRELADGLLTRLGVEVSYYAPTDADQLASLLRPATRLVWCESPGSVTMEVQDVPRIARLAHDNGALVAMDNTWSAGVYFDAFAHGADISAQALSKHVGGHSDLLLGAVTVRDASLYDAIGQTNYELGMAVSPDDCSLALRGIQTLAVRLSAVEASALRLARWLAERPEMELVLHPALPSCPGHEFWVRDFTGSTSTFSIVFDRAFSQQDVFRFVDALRVFRIGYSWGGVTSLALPVKRSGRPDYPYDHRLVRLAIGLESTDDLLADLDEAFATLPAR